MIQITIAREGRRSYIAGNTFPVKEQIKAAGAHWDSGRRAWWIGSHETATQLVATLMTSPAPQEARTPVRNAVPRQWQSMRGYGADGSRLRRCNDGSTRGCTRPACNCGGYDAE